MTHTHSLFPMNGYRLCCACGYEEQLSNLDFYQWMLEHGTVTLSVVILTVPERHARAIEMKGRLHEQIFKCLDLHPSLGTAEIITINTPKVSDGGPSIGFKRQKGVDLSKGKFVAGLDDDDDFSGEYIETLLRLAQENPDVITFKSLCKFPGFWGIADMDLRHTQDEQASSAFKRRPYHVCAFRRELVKDVKFPDTNIDEDTGWISQVLPLCTSQAKYEGILHEYRNFDSIAKKIHQ